MPGIAARRRVTAGARVAVTATSVRARSATPAVEILLAVELPILTPTELAILLPVLAATDLAILLPVLTPTRRQYGEIGIGTRRGREGVGSHRDRACRHDRRQHADEGKCATQKPCA